MKIQVVGVGGRRELITLTEPLTLVPGELLNRIVTGTGMEHWFKLDGTYDGWGINVVEANLNPEQARAYIAAIEQGREFPEEEK